MEDRALIKELVNKNEKAYKDYINKNKQKIFTICFGYLNNIEDSEDVSQEVFIEMYESINTFKYNSKLDTWLYRITINKCLDFIKKKNRLKRKSMLLSFIGIEMKNSNLIINDTPHMLYEKKEESDYLYQLINKLPDNQKTAIMLSNIHGLKYKEIAIILGISESAVDSLISRAKTKLKQMIKNEK